MDELDQRLQSLRMRLHQEEELEDLLLLVEEINKFVKEYPTKEGYSLLTQAFRALSEATSDDPEQGQNLILHHFLPWFIAHEKNESSEDALANSCDILRQWVDQYPERVRQELLLGSLDMLAHALRTRPSVSLCWAIATLGYRRSDVVEELWNVSLSSDERLSDNALRSLEQLAIQGNERHRLLNELHHRIQHRVTVPLLGSLSGLADVSTIPVITQYLKLLPNEEVIPLDRQLALQVLTDIAYAHSNSKDVQEAVWDTLVSLYENAPNYYQFSFYLNSNIVPRLNDPRVPSQIIQWLEKHPSDTQEDSYLRYLLYLRLSECIMPRQLTGVPLSNEEKQLALIQDDVRYNTQNLGLWSTRESHTKTRAWNTLLYIGHASALSRTLFRRAVVQEVSGFLRKEMMESLACFRWKRLPEQVITWITERVDLQKDNPSTSHELVFRRAAEHLARSSSTLQAFEALLAFGMTFQGEPLRETVNSLASVSLNLAKQGEPGIVEILLVNIGEEKEKRHRIAAMQALSWIASNNLLSSQDLPNVVTALEDTWREDFERSRLVDILGCMSVESLTSEIIAVIQQLASSVQPQTAASAREALAKTGIMLRFPEMLETYLPLLLVGEQWEYQSLDNVGYWAVGMICTLYRHAPKLLASAVAKMIESLGVFELPIVLRTLNETHGLRLLPLPDEVSIALRSRLARVEEMVFNTPLELFQTCANLVPDFLVEPAWNGQWSTWTSETRAALAEALGRGKYTKESLQEQCIIYLLLLAGDSQYQVRRSAYRSLAKRSPIMLFRIGVTWAYAPLMELRRRAAEMLSWLPPEDASWSIANGLLTTLLRDDPDPLVRDAVKQVQPERKQRVWANEYLTQVRSTYRKSNNQRLATWRYAHALTVLGDDMTIVELQADLDTKELALYEMQWVLWILNNTREQWKKTVDKWPKPWFAWDGEIMYERGVLSLSEHSAINGIVCLYKDCTDNAIQPPQWRGTFWSDKPISLPEQSITALTSIRNRQGEVRLINQISGVMWLIEEFRDQGL